MKVDKPKESNEQIQNRLRAESENTKAIQDATSDRTNSLRRRSNRRSSVIGRRKSIATGKVSRAAALIGAL